jgi:hypothetical protein
MAGVDLVWCGCGDCGAERSRGAEATTPCGELRLIRELRILPVNPQRGAGGRKSGR